MEIEGKIIQVLPLQSGTSKAGNPWKKQEYVMETLGSYPRKVKFDFFGDRADNNKLELNKTYIVSFDLESREFNGRWYTDVRAYASREATPAVGGDATIPSAAPMAAAPAPAPAQQDPFSPQPTDSPDDLPF